MVAVRGVYQGGDTVILETTSIPVNEPYEVVVAFLNPLKQNEKPNRAADKKKARRQEALLYLKQYKGVLPADFDYKKELSEYRDERYGHIN